ncbi:MAG: RNA polymerase sigma factor [Verrucomicrobiaceae bacterium]|nr:RNA polymerase sigma factor [Verrucomicrobiaceae bacterium]
MQTDLQLLNRYHHQGDAEAFQAIVEAHAGMVHATACRVTRDAALAQDVVQETFLALARSSGSAIQSIGAWLHHVAWQKAQNIVRGECRRQHHEAAAAEQWNDLVTEATWAELEPLVDEALAELPEQTRAMIVECYLAGRTQQELAARMGMSQSTVSRKLDAAIGELRACLKRKGVMCGVGLATLLGTHSANAAPAGLTASLGKVSISGLGTHAATTSTLIAMTTTTKLLLATAAVAVISVPIALQNSPVPQPTKQVAQVEKVTVSMQDSVAKKAPEDGKRHYRPAPVSRQVRQTVEAIMQRHKGMTKAELTKSAELNQLMNRFIAVIEKPEAESKLMQRLAAMPKQLGGGGMLRMDFELLDDAHGRAWLEAAVSNDDQLIEDWILNTLDDAIFEFAFDPELERTSNGVSLQSSPSPSKPAADPGSND